MKIRNGFVSNSSSSSFVCDVCGAIESGMDASASDFDMSECIHGHTFCNRHVENLDTPTPQSLRDTITDMINESFYKTAERKVEQLKELSEVSDYDMEDFFKDNYACDGLPESQCPICKLENLKPDDGFKYLKKKHQLTDKDILEDIKKSFIDYKKFKEYITLSQKT